MGHRGLGRLGVFLLVFAGTIALVAVLSMVTHVSPEAAAEQYIQSLSEQEEPEAEALLAPALGHPGIAWTESLAGFFAIMLVPVAGLLAFLRSRRMGRKTRQSKTYKPGKDMTIERSVSGKTRV